MKLALDRYAYLQSPIHRWEQKYKIVGLLGLIFAFSFIRSLVLLPVIVFITIIIFSLSRLPVSYLISRLRYPGYFILAVVFLLPFVAGDTIIWQWGWLNLRWEGCQETLLIVVRFFCIITVSLVLFGTATILNSIKGLRGLGLPQVILDMTLLTYRYLEELGQMLKTMQRAMKLRGFNPHLFNSRQLEILTRLIGSLIVRSYERSTRIYQAMILRGYGYKVPGKNTIHKKQNNTQSRYDIWLTAIALLAAITLLVLEIFLAV
ncbi:cobalt ABC transporter, permease protein CbiQ [Xenococcus sp. PCC 7305]|uniref:cobalt ECF transporter T component CbiQ n=1 Tax=Xenococcus sp. PCC 7305 TaxID=102125 RepID=UPI0002AC952C|nr:cobalt ECF transporter T component CbiQ [Xenococcus sp. PCC 7305]ELS04323.1 cobalt ABC transporter, permease protein CbiQ [Xenococcus sp. PCC 7305]